MRASKEVAAGASSIVPISAIVNMLQLKERDQFKVGFGEYNRMIDAKIAEIKKECQIK